MCARLMSDLQPRSFVIAPHHSGLISFGPHLVPAARGFPKEEDEVAFRETRHSGEAVMTVLVNESREVLLNLRDDLPHILYPNHWAILGGTVEDGESRDEAVKREIKEEIGYEVQECVEYCHVIDGMGAGHLVTIFIAPIDVAAEDLQLNEGAALRFFAHEELLDLKMTPFLKSAVLHFYESWV